MSIASNQLEHTNYEGSNQLVCDFVYSRPILAGKGSLLTKKLNDSVLEAEEKYSAVPHWVLVKGDRGPSCAESLIENKAELDNKKDEVLEIQ